MKNAFEYEQEIKGLQEELARINGEALIAILKLDAAEQRNAELVESLKSAIEWFDDGVGRSDAEFDFIQSMKATLKPTESGGKRMSSKLDRRKARIEEELRRDRERRAFEMSQPKGPSRRICIADIPYTKFEG